MKVKDFVNPRSMLTPGVAGSLVMLIANTLWVQFIVPQKWSALLLSFLLIIPIVIKYPTSLFEKIIYFIFNGLIIFALAINTNFAGGKIADFVSDSKMTDMGFISEKMPVIQLAMNSNQPIVIADNSTTDTNEKPSDPTDEETTSKPKRDFFGAWL